jgi:hypothetical protein
MANQPELQKFFTSRDAATLLKAAKDFRIGKYSLPSGSYRDNQPNP